MFGLMLLRDRLQEASRVRKEEGFESWLTWPRFWTCRVTCRSPLVVVVVAVVAVAAVVAVVAVVYVSFCESFFSRRENQTL